MLSLSELLKSREFSLVEDEEDKDIHGCVRDISEAGYPLLSWRGL